LNGPRVALWAVLFLPRFLRHRTKRPAARRKTGSVRLPVHEALAFDPAHCRNGPVDIADAKLDAVVVAELILRQIAMKVLLVTMLMPVMPRLKIEKKPSAELV
jgi:hypothetical protein